MTKNKERAMWFFTLIGGIALFAATVPTFARRCAEAYDPKSPAFERCVGRLARGEGGVHYITKIEQIPINE